MFEARQIAPCILSLLITSASLAEDAAAEREGVEQETRAPVSIDALLNESSYGSHWQVTYPVTIVADHTSPTHRVTDLNFRDGSTLSRVGRLRSLSLLTVAKVGRTQVFLGINDDGQIGLHFKSFRPRDYDRHLELLRMSYIKNDEEEDAGAK